jgi:hypothetical protein
VQQVYNKIIWSAVLLFGLMPACQTLFHGNDEGVLLPFLKNSPQECYYLDEFMPVANSVVAGKMGSLNLRYYTYNAATYKEWTDKRVVLSFYSMDEHCWSLFEEFYVNK